MSGDPFATSAAYRAKGWVGTLPLPLGRKTPPPAGFTGDGGAWPSPADLADWAEQAPQNIALRLPPNVIALDVDDTAAFLGLVELVGPLPATWRAHSGGDRLGHLYYRLPAGVVSTGWGAPCPGVDLLRHGHRYSIVAPSVHPSGTTYAWGPPPSALSTYPPSDIPGPGDLPELPAAWVSYLSGGDDSPASGTLPDRPARDDFGTVGDAIPQGSHQEYLFRYACSLRQRRAPEEEAAALVRLRAKQDCRPPWAGPDDPWDAVKHAYERYAEGDAIEVGPALSLVGAPEQTPERRGGIVSGEAFPVVDWFEAWQAPEEEDWILEPLIAAARGIALYSAPKLGKSLLMLEVAVAVSQGQAVIGMTPPRPRTVLYVDHENDLRGDIVRRLRSMNYSPAGLANLRYLSLPIMASLDEPKGGAELLAVAIREGAELVVIDTVSRAISGEENSNDTWLSFYRHTGKALKAAGIACVRLDHSGKDETRGQRGASAKSGDVDAVWQLTRQGDDFLLFCEAQRMGIAEAQRSIAFRRLDEPHLRHERVSTPTRLTEDAKRLRAIWTALEESGLNVDPTTADGAPKTGRAIERELTEAGIAFTKGLAASVVKARWAYLNNDFCPLPSYVEDSGAPAPALSFSTHAQDARPEVPRGAPGVPRSAPGGACPAPSAPHDVVGGTGAPSPAEGIKK